MDWPPQNTGIFAPPSCASCCASIPEPPEKPVYVYGIDGSPYNTYADSYSVVINPVSRDPSTGIIATGTVSWSQQAVVSVDDCSGCMGYECVDEFGNPTGGGNEAWAQIARTWDFYVVAPDVGPGKATDVPIMGDSRGGVTGATNWPECGSGGSTAPYLISHTFIW